jgi:hypothetical protein
VKFVSVEPQMRAAATNRFLDHPAEVGSTSGMLGLCTVDLVLPYMKQLGTYLNAGRGNFHGPTLSSYIIIHFHN